MRSFMFTAAALVAVALAGCSDVPRGRLHGTVTFQGKPLTATTVIFLASDNKTHPVKLKSDGTYEVNGVALGAIKVSVQQDLPTVAAKAEAPRSGTWGQAKGNVVDEKAGKAPPAPRTNEKGSGRQLPASYASAEKSGLSFELTGADQDWSVDLK